MHAWHATAAVTDAALPFFVHSPPSTACPCAFTALHCLSVCTHHHALPFLVSSSPGTAFPRSSTAFHCISLCLRRLPLAVSG